MAKLPFSKLKLEKKDAEIKKLKIFGFEVEVKQYLPADEKLNLISDVINLSIDSENMFYNPAKVDVIGTICIIDYYTNISFTDKQKENLGKLYDSLELNNIINTIFAEIPKNELSTITDWIDETVIEFYKQKNSALGILEQISKDYSDLQFDATQIKNNIGNPDNISLLKDIVNKLG